MPLAVSVPTALTYYETLGRNWERAALLKARPVAGDRGLGEEMVEALRPFVWRRHLDFAAIADIHAMKRRMDAHRGRPIPVGEDAVSRLLGHDLKLGRGGIREIEFLAQTLQLVWGGREPVLRIGATLPALRLLPDWVTCQCRCRPTDPRLSFPAAGGASSTDGGRPADS